jgi:anti-sigma regulatory factor (Ser/Thr protein kinase)/anti-anti-sigma regulatory factor
MIEVDGPDGQAMVVRLAGTLTFDTAPVARRHLLKAVAAQPAVVVADVSELLVPDELALTLFPAVARHAAAWPGIPLVLAAPSREMVAALDRTAVMRYVPVISTVEAACAEVDGTPPHRLAERMPAGPQAVATARTLVREACDRWGHAGLADTAELVTSELASNAVRHAGGSLEVTVALRRRHLHIAVRDRSFDPPRLGRGDSRGLLLVDAMTVGWGCTEVDDGKVVWATLKLS